MRCLVGSVLAFVVLTTTLPCCSRTERGAPSPTSAVPSAVDGAASTPSATASAAPSAPSAATAASANAPDAALAAPRGVATLVVQRVNADCGGVGSWGGNGESEHYLGTDVLVLLVADDAPHAKAIKEFAFCPSRLEDGGAQKPKLSLWQYCSAFPSCKIVSPDAGSETRVEVQCGKENVVLESVGAHTVLRGSFGERELAPYPMKIAPIKSELRRAMVDC